LLNSLYSLGLEVVMLGAVNIGVKNKKKIYTLDEVKEG